MATIRIIRLRSVLVYAIFFSFIAQDLNEHSAHQATQSVEIGQFCALVINCLNAIFLCL